MAQLSDEEWRDRLKELYSFNNLPDVVDMVSVSDLPDEVRSDLLGVIESPKPCRPIPCPSE